MKILWMSDSPNLTTGYGIVTDNIVRRLIKLGHSVEVIGWNNTQKESYNGYTIHPRNKDLYCKDVILDYISKFKPDYLITLCDLSFIKYFEELDLNVRWIPYYPFDGGLPAPTEFIPLLKKAYKRIAMSKHTQFMTKELGLDSELIYHGVDLDIFKPMNKENIKKEFGLENKFIIGMVARNQMRKMIPELIKTFKIFSKDKDDVILYLHTEMNSKMGWDLKDFVNKHKLNEKVIFSNIKNLGIGLKQEEMCKIYNLFDVHALSTSGEGFGLPVLESMACGIPNVLTDFTTSRELVEGRGELVKVKTTITGPFNMERAIVDIDVFAKKLELLYQNDVLMKEYSKKSIEFAKKYSWDNIIKEWNKIITFSY